MTLVHRWLLLQWRAAIQLEAKGMKHSSGRSVTAHARRFVGGRTRDDVLQKIQERLDRGEYLR